MGENTMRSWRIDVHHHVVPPQYADDSMPIKIPDTETQLNSMDNWRIRTAITSLTPRVVLKNLHRLRGVARACNEFQARMVLEHPSRFGSFALLPLPDVDGAMEEITYALDILHLDGVGLFSSVNDRYLGDPLFDPVFDELNRRNAVVFVHPTHCEAPTETNLQAPPFVVEYVFDTTRAIVNLLYAGAAERYPNVRIIFSHAGGAVPFLTHRIAAIAHRAHVEAVPMLRSFYYDVAIAMAPYALRSLQELAEPTHILWGSDLPFVHRDQLQEEIAAWEAYDGFTPPGRAAVERDNALRLFPRLAAASAVS